MVYQRTSPPADEKAELKAPAYPKRLSRQTRRHFAGVHTVNSAPSSLKQFPRKADFFTVDLNHAAGGRLCTDASPGNPCY